MKHYEKIVLHIPHSSIQDYAYGWSRTAFMFPVVKRLTDWHTDILFHSSNPNVERVVFPHSRFFVDVERLVDDPLNEIGQGIIYTKYDGFKRNLSDDETNQLMGIYSEWRNQFTNLVTDNTLVIDCHSFPSDVSPEIDVCIGFNEDQSKPDDDVIRYIQNKFRILGYRVAINAPYSNSIVFGGGHHSLMIELRKGIYMNEDTLIMQPKTYKIGGTINNIYAALTNSI